VIVGAGKISRGFIAHLLFVSGREFVFVEKDSALVELINKNKKYVLNVFGAPQKNVVIAPVRAIALSDNNSVTKTLAGSDLIFISVGGKNLESLAPVLAEALGIRFANNNQQFINIITCENWHSPADALKTGILGHLADEYVGCFDERVGITEAAILRTAIEADDNLLAKDPLALNVSDHWEIPLDGSRIKGELPEITGLCPISPFNSFLDRKLYTFNAASATVSYLGHLKGYRILAEAIRDQHIEKILAGVYQETGNALCKKFDLPPSQQEQLQKACLEKYRDKKIIDLIERNARDPVRKLGPDDRLIGPANMALQYAIEPTNLATAIAAAIFYDHPQDPIAQRLQQIRKEQGIDAVLTDICKIDPQSKLALLIKQKIAELEGMGLIETK
jgi:mannitol-1-phosphate 5-dehydrogenase